MLQQAPQMSPAHGSIPHELPRASRRRATPPSRFLPRRCRCCSAWPAPSTSCCPPPTTTRQNGAGGRGWLGRWACDAARLILHVPRPGGALNAVDMSSQACLPAAGKETRITLRRRCCMPSTRAATTWRGRRSQVGRGQGLGSCGVVEQTDCPSAVAFASHPSLSCVTMQVQWWVLWWG